MRCENKDLFKAMEKITEAYVKYYKTDFEIDKKMILWNLKRKDKEEIYFIWLIRPCGTNLVPLDESFIRNISGHNTVCYYYEQDLTGVKPFLIRAENKNGTVEGSIYELDYDRLYTEYLSKAPYAKAIRYVYEDGYEEVFDTKNEFYVSDSSHGRLLYREGITEEETRYLKMIEKIKEETKREKEIIIDESIARIC